MRAGRSGNGGGGQGLAVTKGGPLVAAAIARHPRWKPQLTVVTALPLRRRTTRPILVALRRPTSSQRRRAVYRRRRRQRHPKVQPKVS